MSSTVNIYGHTQTTLLMEDNFSSLKKDLKNAKKLNIFYFDEASIIEELQDLLKE